MVHGCDAEKGTGKLRVQCSPDGHHSLCNQPVTEAARAGEVAVLMQYVRGLMCCWRHTSDPVYHQLMVSWKCTFHLYLFRVDMFGFNCNWAIKHTLDCFSGSKPLLERSPLDAHCLSQRLTTLPTCVNGVIPW